MSGTYFVTPLVVPPDAVVHVPGSKSETNRVLPVAALATGTSVLDGVLFSDDTEAMLDSLLRLGVVLDVDRDRARVTVHGTGGALAPGERVLDARQSGTTARFLLPLVALRTSPTVVDGSPQLRSRPMGDLTSALSQLGVVVLGEHLPLRVPARVAVHSGRDGEEGSTGVIAGGTCRLRGDVSSQFLSGLLLAAPCFHGGVRIELSTPLVSRPYVDLTCAVMARFGVEVGRETHDVFVVPQAPYQATRLWVEPDASAASYFFAAAVICGGRVRIEGLGTRTVQGDLRFVDVLSRMGAQVVRTSDYTEVRSTGTLRGIDVDMSDISDTAQTLAAVAVFADAPTRVRGIGFIRRKETDRIAAVVTELRRCGIDAVEEDDGFVVHPGIPRAAIVATYDDHRMAMSFSLLGLRVPGIEIAGPGCVAKTFPDFFSALERLGSPDTRRLR